LDFGSQLPVSGQCLTDSQSQGRQRIFIRRISRYIGDRLRHCLTLLPGPKDPLQQPPTQPNRRIRRLVTDLHQNSPAIRSHRRGRVRHHITRQ
jgi:hypothetical protein